MHSKCCGEDCSLGPPERSDGKPLTIKSMGDLSACLSEHQCQMHSYRNLCYQGLVVGDKVRCSDPFHKMVS